MPSWNAKRPTAPRGARDLGQRLLRQRVAPRPGCAPRRSWVGLRRALWWVTRRTAALGALLGGVSLVLVMVWWSAVGSGYFAVTEALVVGARHLTRLQVLSAAGVGAHSNTITLPVARIEARLESLPFIRSAQVGVVLPHTVRIEIVERTPAALALSEGNLFYLDEDLNFLAPVPAGPPPDLPMITGVSQADLAQPDPETRRLLDLAHDLIAQVPHAQAGPAGWLSEVHLDRVWGISLVFSRLPATVRLGHEDLGHRLARLPRVMADLVTRDELAAASLIDLSHSQRVVVRLCKEEA